MAPFYVKNYWISSVDCNRFRCYNNIINNAPVVYDWIRIIRSQRVELGSTPSRGASFMPFTKYKNDHYQNCKVCNNKLTTIEDYISGGSHYWVLVCKKCNKYYTYDTYSFKLESH